MNKTFLLLGYTYRSSENKTSSFSMASKNQKKISSNSHAISDAT